MFIALFLGINLHGSAFSQNNNSLQWFPTLAADNHTVYIVWADERNGNYTRIMNAQPHKSGDIYLSKGPSIAVDSNNIYAVWEDDRFGFEELYFTSSTKNNIEYGSMTTRKATRCILLLLS